jgi:hypothetical protein
MVSLLGSAKRALKRALASQYGTAWNYGHKIRVVAMDGESAAAKVAEDTIRDIKFAPLPAGVRSSGLVTETRNDTPSTYIISQ